MKILNVREEIVIPEGVELTIEGNKLTVKGKKGELSRVFNLLKINITKEDNKCVIAVAKLTKREKKQVYTVKAHINNMFTGVLTGHTYRLKICSGHFPMNVSISGNKLSVKNFLGEKIPRVLIIKEGANVKLDGELVVVKGIDKEIAGQVAADIEQLTRITDRDIRIFQDGIYIVSKSGK